MSPQDRAPGKTGVKLRRLVTFVEEIREEAGRPIDPPILRAASVAVIGNPFAGRYEDDLSVLIAAGSTLGAELARRCIAALAVGPEAIESYGKAALVGAEGELEHAAALLHPEMGRPVRAMLGGGAALIPSVKTRGGVGASLDIPLGHKDAAYVRSHFDGMTIRVPDAPRADEIVLALALATSGRPLPRVGGLESRDISGIDGLR